MLKKVSKKLVIYSIVTAFVLAALVGCTPKPPAPPPVVDEPDVLDEVQYFNATLGAEPATMDPKPTL